MPVKWKRNPRHPGVRWYEHTARRHRGRPDRYYTIYYTRAGRRREEGLGWASEGWTLDKASLERGRLQEAHRLGRGPTTMAARRAVSARDGLDKETFGGVWLDYYDDARLRKRSARRERQLYQKWIEPELARRRLDEISVADLDRIRRQMVRAGLADATCRYAMAVVRQVYNWARARNRWSGTAPTAGLRWQPVDNTRLRYLTRDEAAALLAELAVRSRSVHDQALLSLHCGLRWGEIAGLTWADVDLDKGILTLRDTKNRLTRYAYLTDTAKEMLKARRRLHPRRKGYVFVSADGKKLGGLSRTYRRAVNAVGLNDDVTDRRYRVCFHTLRHTFASWLVQAGVDLYRVQHLLGHKSASMVQRYAHLGADDLRTAVRAIEEE